MALSPAQQHFQRVTAQQASGENPNRASSSLQQQMEAALYQHKNQLKNIESKERKAIFKAKVLPEYQAYVEGVLAGDSGEQNMVISTLFIWYVDVGEIDAAIEVGEYLLRHDIDMPDQFSRSAVSVIVEEIAELALKADSPVTVYHLEKLQSMAEGRDMVDEVSAKLFKALGFAYRDQGFTEPAITALKRALELNEKAGVKNEIKKLEKQLQESSNTD